MSARICTHAYVTNLTFMYNASVVAYACSCLCFCDCICDKCVCTWVCMRECAWVSARDCGNEKEGGVSGRQG